MQEKAQIFESSWCYSRFLIHFSIRKKWPILCFRIPILQSKQVSFIRSTPAYICTYAVSPTKPDQNMTNLRCTADHHAVPLLNIRPVDSGIIPDHFSTGWKTYPAHHDLSERARPTPTVFFINIRSPQSRPAHCRSAHFSRAGASGGWSALWCERG